MILYGLDLQTMGHFGTVWVLAISWWHCRSAANIHQEACEHSEHQAKTEPSLSPHSDMALANRQEER